MKRFPVGSLLLLICFVMNSNAVGQQFQVVDHAEAQRVQQSLHEMGLGDLAVQVAERLQQRDREAWERTEKVVRWLRQNGMNDIAESVIQRRKHVQAPDGGKMNRPLQPQPQMIEPRPNLRQPANERDFQQLVPNRELRQEGPGTIIMGDVERLKQQFLAEHQEREARLQRREREIERLKSEMEKRAETFRQEVDRVKQELQAARHDQEIAEKRKKQIEEIEKRRELELREFEKQRQKEAIEFKGRSDPERVREKPKQENPEQPTKKEDDKKQSGNTDDNRGGVV